MKIISLHLYPVKSCAGLDVDSFQLDDRGPVVGAVHDRGWMIMDEANKVFLSQRNYPQMTQIKPSIHEGKLRLEVSGRQYDIKSGPGENFAAAIWDSVCQVTDEGDEIARALSDFLEVDVRLVRMADGCERPLSEKYQTAPGGPGSQTLFADAMPVLLTTTGSLEELNRRTPAPVPMNRFRANVVVSLDEAFAEDGWSKLMIASVSFRVTKACARCVIVNTDQVSGQRGVEPLKTLASFRRQTNKVLFGQYLAHESTGEIRVGDTVALV